MSPRKVRLIIDMVRGMSVGQAVFQLSVSDKLAAKPVLKLLNSAVANAINNHKMKEDTLKIKTIFVDGGAIMYRWQPHAMGRATPIRKRTSHITIVLSGETEVEKKQVEKTEAPVDTADTTVDAKIEKKKKTTVSRKVTKKKEK